MGHGMLKVHAVKSSKILENTSRGDCEAIVDIQKIYNHANEPSQRQRAKPLLYVRDGNPKNVEEKTEETQV